MSTELGALGATSRVCCAPHGKRVLWRSRAQTLVRGTAFAVQAL